MSKVIDLRKRMPGGASKRREDQIRKIGVHYSGTKSGNALIFARHHTTPRPNGLGWSTSGYNEVILLNGDVEICYDPNVITNGVLGHNPTTYNICYVGDGLPNAAQRKTLEERVRFNMQRLKLKASDVLGHREFPNQSTACPGLSMTLFRAELTNTQPVATQVEASVIFNNNKISAFVELGTTYAQMRTLANLVNARVDWDEKLKQAYLNGQEVEGKIVNDRTYLPVRHIAERLNLSVQWDQLNRTVKIA